MADTHRQSSRFTAIFAAGTMLSRVLGLVRDMVWVVIPSASLAPFLVAFRFPNMLRDLVGEGASNAAFVPVFSETLDKDGEEGFLELVSAAMSFMLIVLAVLSVLGLFLVPWMLNGINALDALTGAEPRAQEDIELMQTLTRWVFPYLFFIGMTVFAMGALFTKGRYATSSWSPALLNVAIIACCLLFHKRFAEPAYALVLGIWLGGIAQLVVQYISMGRHVGVWWPNFRLGHPGIRKVVWLLLPVLIGQATGEVNKLVDALFAYHLGDDRVTAMWYANRLVQLPFSMFGLAVAAAILPSISRAGARRDFDEVQSTLKHGLRQSFFLIFPSLVGLIILREPIIRLLFEHRAFTADDTARTAAVLVYLAAGLLSIAWVRIAVAGFYAVQDTKTPVIVASSSMFLNILMNFALVRYMDYLGLAFATTVSYTVNFLLLYALLWNRYGALWDRPFIDSLVRMLVATLLMGLFVYGLDVWAHQAFPSSRLACVLVPLAGAVVAYLGLCRLLNVPELRSFTASLSRLKTTK